MFWICQENLLTIFANQNKGTDLSQNFLPVYQMQPKQVLHFLVLVEYYCGLALAFDQVTGSPRFLVYVPQQAWTHHCNYQNDAIYETSLFQAVGRIELTRYVTKLH